MSINWKLLKKLSENQEPDAPYPVKVEVAEKGLIWTMNGGERILVTENHGFPALSVGLWGKPVHVRCPITLTNIGQIDDAMRAEMRNALTRAGVRELPKYTDDLCDYHYPITRQKLFHEWLLMWRNLQIALDSTIRRG